MWFNVTQVTLQPYATAELALEYVPSSLGEEEVGVVKLHGEEIGEGCLAWMCHGQYL